MIDGFSTLSLFLLFQGNVQIIQPNLYQQYAIFLQQNSTSKVIMDQDADYGPTGDAHLAVMAYIWGPVINLGIILVMYSYRIRWVVIHGLIALFAFLFTISTSIPILNTTGVISSDSSFLDEYPLLDIHYKIGITCLVIISIQVLMGLAAILMQLFQAKSLFIVWMKRAHAIFGYTIIILIKSNYYINFSIDQTFWGFLAQDIAFVILLTIRKISFPKMEAKSQARIQDSELRGIQSLAQLTEDTIHVAFGNYVYDVTPLKQLHPGGFEVIESVRNREIDRYIYGMHSSQLLPEVPTHSHSFRAFSLLGSPVAKITISPIFSGFIEEEEEVNILSINQITRNGNFYEMKLVKKEGSFNFQRYVHVSQLGRYYSLTVNNKVTRLYTGVNFLTDINIKFLQRYMRLSAEEFSFNIVDDSCRRRSINGRKSSQLIAINSSSQIAQEQYEPYVPILFKRCNGGKMTEILASGKVQSLRLSCEKGEGLQFGRLKPGRVIMVAGGSGMNPFCDLIDLLFKQQLLINAPEIRREVHELSPVLAADPFKPFTFQLIAAFQSLDDLHPITLRQIAFLSKRGRLKLTLKIKDCSGGGLRELYNVRVISTTFQEELQNELKDGAISRLWVCGPPKMNENISKFMRSRNYTPQTFLIL